MTLFSEPQQLYTDWGTGPYRLLLAGQFEDNGTMSSRRFGTFVPFKLHTSVQHSVVYDVILP